LLLPIPIHWSIHWIDSIGLILFFSSLSLPFIYIYITHPHSLIRCIWTMRAERGYRTCCSFILFLFFLSLLHTLASKSCHNFYVNIGVVLFSSRCSLSSGLILHRKKERKCEKQRT
jgi:formate hydrogenlyase subunit 3/multisubunit Na+/H+ antiporter MnhD subunit